jgi:hypothetical protein
MTRAQVSLINVLFVFFQLCMVLGWSVRWELALSVLVAALCHEGSLAQVRSGLEIESSVRP